MVTILCPSKPCGLVHPTSASMSLSTTGFLRTASTETIYFAKDFIPLGNNVSGHSAPSNCPTVTARERLKKVGLLTVLFSRIYTVTVDGQASDETCEDIIELQRSGLDREFVYCDG